MLLILYLFSKVRKNKPCIPITMMNNLIWFSKSQLILNSLDALKLLRHFPFQVVKWYFQNHALKYKVEFKCKSGCWWQDVFPQIP